MNGSLRSESITETWDVHISDRLTGADYLGEVQATVSRRQHKTARSI